jgi:hypothetical protein
MSVKVPIFIVIILLLWGTLQSPRLNQFSGNKEAKIGAQLLDASIKADKDFIWEKALVTDRLSYENTASRKARLQCDAKKNPMSFTPIPVKLYLRFRVFRN